MPRRKNDRPDLPAGLGLYWHKKTGGIWTRFWIDGREYRRSCKTKDPREAPAEAAKRRAESRAEAARCDPGRARLEDLAVDDILERSRKRRTKAHIASLESRWAVILRNIGVVHADEITADVLLQYEGLRRAGVWGTVTRGRKVKRQVEGWVDRPARGQTIVREFHAIERVLRLAMEQGKLGALPRFPDVDRDPPDARRAGKRWPVDLIRKWADSLHQDARDEVMFAALTGLRYQECKRVEARWVERAPPGARTEFVLRIPAESTKTRQERTIGLSSAAAAIIARRVDEENRRPTVFSPSNFRKHRETKARHLGYPSPPTMRDLRHTCASIALEQTSDPGAVMRALGHTDLRMTERYISSTMNRITGVSVAVDSAYQPEHQTGALEAKTGVSRARDSGFEPETFGSGGQVASAKWLQSLARTVDSERERTAKNGTQPEHLTGAPIRRLRGAS